MIQIDMSERNGIVTVSVAGEISLHTVKEFNSALEKYTTSGCKVIALDLKNLPYLDSFAISRLIKLSQSLKEKNIKFILVNLNEHLKQIFHMGTFDKLFTIMTGDEFEAGFFPAGSSDQKKITGTIIKDSEPKATKIVHHKYDDKSGTILLFEEEEIKGSGE